MKHRLAAQKLSQAGAENLQSINRVRNARTALPHFLSVSLSLVLPCGRRRSGSKEFCPRPSAGSPKTHPFCSRSAKGCMRVLLCFVVFCCVLLCCCVVWCGVVLLCCVVLCCVVLCCVVLCCVVVCCVCVVLCCL